MIQHPVKFHSATMAVVNEVIRGSIFGAESV